MNAHQAYSGSRRHSWTRIDMVIALYQATLTSMEQLGQELAEGQVLPTTQMKLQRRLLGILAGLDLSAGDLPMRIAQLVRWALSQLRTPNPKSGDRSSKPFEPFVRPTNQSGKKRPSRNWRARAFCSTVCGRMEAKLRQSPRRRPREPAHSFGRWSSYLLTTATAKDLG